MAEYSIGESNEAFTIDDLGNRDSVNVRDENEKVEIVDYSRWLSLVMPSYVLAQSRGLRGRKEEACMTVPREEIVHKVPWHLSQE
jgi:hypothetical protein